MEHQAGGQWRGSIGNCDMEKERDTFLRAESITKTADSSCYGFCITKNVYP